MRLCDLLLYGLGIVWFEFSVLRLKFLVWLRLAGFIYHALYCGVHYEIPFSEGAWPIE